MTSPPRLLAEKTLHADALRVGFPAPPHHVHKRRLRELAWPLGVVEPGTLHVSRWAEGLDPVAPTAPVVTEVRVRPDAFAYEAAAAGEVHWHVNFADPALFGFHSGPLFAQDEIQVAEHPILASVRDLLIDEHIPARTEEHGRATPVLVAGALRRLAIDLGPQEDAPRGLYGNEFAWAPWEVVRAATTVLDPPTVSNIAAMAAPVGRHGPYTRAQITHVLGTAITTFSAARVVGERLHGPGGTVVVHSGFWGCGAFGGNRLLMPALQVLAARRAGVHRLDLHALGPGGTETMHAGVALAEEIGAGDDVQAWIDAAVARGLCWGTRDGT